MAGVVTVRYGDGMTNTAIARTRSAAQALWGVAVALLAMWLVDLGVGTDELDPALIGFGGAVVVPPAVAAVMTVHDRLVRRWPWLARAFVVAAQPDYKPSPPSPRGESGTVVETQVVQRRLPPRP